MKLNKIQERIWSEVRQDLEDEPVASTDHVERMTTWCQKIGVEHGADMDVLTAGALLHDIGVTVDRKNHYLAGRKRASEILRKVDFPKDKIEDALHVLESHSRYGGPDPETVEGKVGQDADALEYIGAIGIIRAVVRGLKDGSYDGKIKSFPGFLRSLLGKVEGTFHFAEAEEVGLRRIEFMNRFLELIEKELNFRQ